MLRPPKAKPDGNEAAQVEAAQRGDAAMREQLIAAYTPMVLRTGARLCGRYLQVGRDDEVSVGLLALNEAVDRWRRDQGASFPSFAEMVVRRRLIDHFRHEGARRETPVSDFDQADDEGEVWNPLESAQAVAMERDRREAEDRRAEIERFREILRRYGITLGDLLHASPRHSDARSRGITVARAIAGSPEWTDYLRRNRALPLRELQACAELGVSRKTMERQRKFIIAVAVILVEGLDALRSYVPGA